MTPFCHNRRLGYGYGKRLPNLSKGDNPMKKNALILALALLVALPLFGLAAETAIAPVEETPAATLPAGARFGRRWSQAPAEGTAPYGFTDENADGVCDVCGMEQGRNTQAPGFVDADGDGVCDHSGTDLQHTFGGRMQNQAPGGFGRGRNQSSFGGGRHRR